ncbi:hypothetical protein BR1R3_30110 [Pseudomonas atacamensis]|jgi:hypothetical protein|nr:hypothetical protein BR1R3_30110 [Pseudomonas atacamensis]
MAYIQGQSRSQTSLFPVSLEELIPEDHLVRVIDLYVAKLDLVRLGFDKALPKSTGRPLTIQRISSNSTSTAISSGFAHHDGSKPSASATSK